MAANAGNTAFQLQARPADSSGYAWNSLNKRFFIPENRVATLIAGKARRWWRCCSEFFGKRPRERDICALQMSSFDAPNVAF